jgi:hypothetical protein
MSVFHLLREMEKVHPTKVHVSFAKRVQPNLNIVVTRLIGNSATDA